MNRSVRASVDDPAPDVSPRRVLPAAPHRLPVKSIHQVSHPFRLLEPDRVDTLEPMKFIPPLRESQPR